MALPAKTTVIIAAAAFIMASFSAYLVYSYLSAKNREAAMARLEVQPVAVAASDIPFGVSIQPAQVKLADWPKKNLPQGSWGDVTHVENSLAVTSIPAGAPILESDLAPKNGEAGVMSYIIKPGKRAITVAVNDVVGVAGFVLPNSMVDVVATVDSPYGRAADGGRNLITKIVLQDVRVLAVGQILVQKEGKPVKVPTVTLDVSPEDAEKLVLASQNKLQLILRRIDDSDIAQTKGETVASLLGGIAPAPKSAVLHGAGRGRARVRRRAVKASRTVRPAGVSIEVIKGSLRTNESFK